MEAKRFTARHERLAYLWVRIGRQEGSGDTGAEQVEELGAWQEEASGIQSEIALDTRAGRQFIRLVLECADEIRRSGG